MSEIKYVDSVALGTFLTEIRKEFKQQIIDMVYPIGSIYMSFEDKNPETLFGGTWKKIEGKFLLGADLAHKVDDAETGIGTGILTPENIPEFTGTIGTGTGNYGAFRHAKDAFEFVADTKATYVYDHSNTVNASGTYKQVKLSIGSANPSPIYPPYIAVYMWRRVEEGFDPIETFTLDQSLLDSNDILA